MCVFLSPSIRLHYTLIANLLNKYVDGAARYELLCVLPSSSSVHEQDGILRRPHYKAYLRRNFFMSPSQILFSCLSSKYAHNFLIGVGKNALGIGK